MVDIDERTDKEIDRQIVDNVYDVNEIHSPQK